VRQASAAYCANTPLLPYGCSANAAQPVTQLARSVVSLTPGFFVPGSVPSGWRPAPCRVHRLATVLLACRVAAGCGLNLFIGLRCRFGPLKR